MKCFLLHGALVYIYKRNLNTFLRLTAANSKLTSNEYKAVLSVSDTTVIGLQSNGSFQLFQSTNDSILIFELKSLSDYFKSKTISDISISENELVIISSDGLYLIDKNNIFNSPINSSLFDKEEGFALKGFGYFCDNSDLDKKNIFIYSSNELLEINLNSIKKIIANQKTNFKIGKVFINNEIYSSDSISFIKVGYNENNIRIILEVKNLNNPKKDLFRFKIDGDKYSWSKWSNNNEIQLTNLHYGKYKLIFQHKNKIRSEVISTKILHLKINPPWWETKWFFCLIIIWIGITTYLFNLRRLRKIKKRQKELEHKIYEATIEIKFQRDAIADQHKEITDSINYAKRIQSAILPSTELFNQKLKNSFVYYLPKDIVAGDFYWVEEKNNTILFAACDCTGHGVPGAMVSVICNNGLNRSVREHNLTDPGAILNKTREIILQEFEKSEEDVKDGMDAAICTLKDSSLSYAGAYNPLWIIRKGENKIVEIKGDKQPIGKYIKSKPFKTHKLKINSGDTIYIFSDGFADQFGGKKGKKFKTANFKKLLLSIQSHTMKKQQELIALAFEKYKGNLEQLDDICIIGVRI